MSRMRTDGFKRCIEGYGHWAGLRSLRSTLIDYERAGFQKGWEIKSIGGFSGHHCGSSRKTVNGAGLKVL